VSTEGREYRVPDVCRKITRAADLHNGNASDAADRNEVRAVPPAPNCHGIAGDYFHTIPCRVRPSTPAHALQNDYPAELRSSPSQTGQAISAASRGRADGEGLSAMDGSAEGRAVAAADQG